jgi:hypothetical protein
MTVDSGTVGMTKPRTRRRTDTDWGLPGEGRLSAWTGGPTEWRPSEEGDLSALMGGPVTLPPGQAHKKSSPGRRSLRLGANPYLEDDHHDPVFPTVDRPTETLSSNSSRSCCGQYRLDADRSRCLSESPIRLRRSTSGMVLTVLSVAHSRGRRAASLSCSRSPAAIRDEGGMVEVH